MGVLAKIRVLDITADILKITASALAVIGVVILVLNLIQNLEYIEPIIEANDTSAFFSWLYRVLATPIILFAASSIVGAVARVMAKRAETGYQNFVKELIGRIRMYKRIAISDLARFFGESPRNIESILARLSHEGVFKGYVEKGVVVYSEQETMAPVPPVISSPARNEEDVERIDVEADLGETRIVAPEAESGARDTSSIAEVGDINERIEKLREAYEKGLISRETYEKMLRELKGQQQ
jgi:hypothetical protein